MIVGFLDGILTWLQAMRVGMGDMCAINQ